MCGLAGILRLDGAPLTEDIEPTLRSMGRQLARRGPDDEQLYLSGPIGLIFRRLSIVDLEHGRQPMANEDGSIILAANGEIFNHHELRRKLRRRHQFHSESDCEVILHLYEELGAAFVEQLRGMYGLALWDSRSHRLYLARDRLGIKPMFYAQTEEFLLFGSEIKALLAHPACPRSFDWEQALADPFHKRDVFSEAPVSSFFRGIEQLPGGEMLLAQSTKGTVTRKPYWNLPFPSVEEYNTDMRNEKQIIEGYRDLLEDAVRDCLMSDVEFGAFLSGGIDSVAVSSIASTHSFFHTFTVLSQSTFGNGDAEAAHFAAEAFKLANHEVLYQWQQAWKSPQQWKDLLWTCETFHCGPEQLYKYQLHRYAKAVRPDLKVILLGQGSDEFNGGYSRKDGAPHNGEHRSWEQFLHALSIWEQEACLDKLPDTFRFLDQALRVHLFKPSFLSAISNRASSPELWYEYVKYRRVALQMFNLWHEDRTAAANGIENRVPFLDHRLVEYALRIPPKFHQTLFWDKRILREALRDKVPENLRMRVKVAFYQGIDVRYTNRMMLRLLTAEGSALIEEAFANSAVFDATSMRSVLKHITIDPEARHLPLFLMLTNMALLEQAAIQVPSVRAEINDIVSAYEIKDWASNKDLLATTLAAVVDDSYLDHPIRFASNAALLEGRVQNYPQDKSYLIVNDEVRFVFSEVLHGDWLKVLRNIDGTKSFRDIIREQNISEAAIRRYFEDSIEFGALVVD